MKTDESAEERQMNSMKQLHKMFRASQYVQNLIAIAFQFEHFLFESTMYSISIEETHATVAWSRHATTNMTPVSLLNGLTMAIKTMGNYFIV